MGNGEQLSSVAIGVKDCTKADASSSAAPSRVTQRVVVATETSEHYEFSLAVDRIDSRFFDNNLRLGVLPQGDLPEARWIASENVPFRSAGGGHQANFKIDKDASALPQAAFQKPQQLRAALVLELADKAAYQRHPVQGSPVYYPSQNDTVVKVDGPDDLALDDKDIVLTLPPYHAEAYPGMRTSGVSAWLAGNRDIGISVSFAFDRVGSDRTVPGHIRLSDEAALEAWQELSGTQKVEFAFDDATLPEMADLTIEK